MRADEQHFEHIARHVVRRFCSECMVILTPDERVAFDRMVGIKAQPGLPFYVTREYLRDAAGAAPVAPIVAPGGGSGRESNTPDAE